MPIQPFKVDVALFWPQACICGAQKGPLLDTGIELAGTGRVYLCSLCAKLVAVTMAYGDGEELDRVHEAAQELTQTRTELEAVRKEKEKLEGYLLMFEEREQGLKADLKIAEGRGDQLARTLKDVRDTMEAQLGATEPEPEDEARAEPVMS